jgi:hypothetical protein
MPLVARNSWSAVRTDELLDSVQELGHLSSKNSCKYLQIGGSPL